MSRKLQARPTEYKGVLYRSKSEAMFARWLELRAEPLSLRGFLYEPPEFEVDGWRPDFFAWTAVKYLPKLHYYFFEYKPSKPTAAYMAEFGERLASIDSLIGNNRSIGGISGIIACGGFFSQAQYWFNAQVDSSGRLFFKELGSRWLSNSEWVEIQQTRFDLEHGGDNVER